MSDILQPKPKVEFRKRLNEDIERFCSSGLPKYPIYVSSSCEPFQPLEATYGHSLYTLRRLAENGFPIIIMTKNPEKLLEHDYLKVLSESKVIIQVTIPFSDSRFEPYSPPPERRIKAVAELIEMGFTVTVRLDPLIPSFGGVKGQSKEEISFLVSKFSDVGVSYIVSKCLRLVPGIAKMYPTFYYTAKPYFKNRASEEGLCELSLEAKKELLTPVYQACREHGMKLCTCLDHIAFPHSTFCDMAEELFTM